MFRKLAVLLLAAAAACGSGSSGNAKKASTTATTTTPSGGLALSSSAFADNGSIPREYTCDGANRSPPLSWSGIPPKTASLALQVEDIDTPTNFVHWIVYGIPPSTTSLSAGQVPSGAVQAANSFGKKGYGGPCPQTGRHRYVFTVVALETQLNASAETDPHQLWSTILRSAVLGTGRLTGTYTRG